MRFDSSINRVAAALFGGRAPGLLNVFSCYFDDSGTDRASKVIAVAGYLESIEKWSSFEIVWKQALDDFDLPYFRMSEFAQSRGPFESWS